MLLTMASSSSEKFKMLFILSIVASLFLTIKTESATDLLNLPLNVETGSVLIKATLTDSNGANKYSIQEFISASDSSIKGKIEISGEKDNYNIHYNTKFNFNKKRLVIYGTNCLILNHKNDWDQSLPGISKPVTNLLLLMGPSILYRLDHSSLVWEAVADKNVRGTMMKGASTTINNRLKITYYYKSHFNDQGIKYASRIEFSGYEPYSTSYSIKENLVLDIYLRSENANDQFANEVQPLPGIGCTYYLSEPVTGSTSLTPYLQAKHVHYTMYEHIQSSNSRTFSEIYASEKNQLLRVKATLLSATTEAIYDYQLGVSFLLQEDGYCNTASADLNSPGINSDGYFNVLNLLLLQFNFKYLGKLNLEHRSGFAVKVWEAVKYNFNLNGKKVDKAVITQYFVESENSQLFTGYTLVSTKITTYALDSSRKTYTLLDTITRDYINFENTGSEDELHDIFSLKQCKYSTSEETLTLAFKLQCQDDSHPCTKLTDIGVYALKQSFMDNIILHENISPLRIDTVQFNSNDETQFEMEVTFLDSPDLKSFIKPESMSVSPDAFKKMITFAAKDEYDCLDKISNYQRNINVVVYRPSDNFCGFLRVLDDLKEDTEIGQPCRVYLFPLHNLRHVKNEMPLDQINDYFLKVVGDTYALFVGNIFQRYKVIDVIDKTQNKITSPDYLQFKFEFGAKLNINDQTAIAVPEVKNFADCYRYCHDSEQFKCHTFSICQNDDSVDCRVSRLSTGDLLSGSHTEKDAKCSIFALNILNSYTEVHHKKFKTQNSITMQKTTYSCAESCHASPDCFSFQFCGGSCSFGGFYTDSATEYDDKCSVFFPEVSESYQKTGNKIVSDVIYTELNLNFEQCASLCHGWSDGDTECKSFNYCPKSKTESSCSLTKFSVKSSETETTEGGHCSNYELKPESKGKKSKESSSTEVTKGTSGAGAFGIIMLFLFIGALLGIATPIAYTKVKQMRIPSEANESFTWTKQVNEQL